jgi:hypothetical protein
MAAATAAPVLPVIRRAHIFQQVAANHGQRLLAGKIAADP